MLLIAGVSARLPLDESYRGFYELLAAAVTAALGTVRAREDEGRRAEALAALDRAKTAFFSNVSHEFRTPLTLLLGPLEESLQHAAELPPDARERVSLAYRNAQRLLKLVNTLLDFSRIEAGRLQAAYHPTDLAALTADLASHFRAATDGAGLQLCVDAPALDEAVHLDRGTDGAEALSAARRAGPDLVLSDVMMPVLDGFALLKAWREDGSLREIPFILLSARAGEEARVEGLEAGADDYLTKPFSAREPGLAHVARLA